MALNSKHLNCFMVENELKMNLNSVYFQSIFKQETLRVATVTMICHTCGSS